MVDATIRVTADSPVAIYRQIAEQVRTYIANGTLCGGQALPSVRSLATQLGVHFNTAAEAYRELSDEGLIDVAQGRRAVVRAGQARVCAEPEAMDGLRQKLRHLVSEMRLKGATRASIRQQVNASLREVGR